MAFPEEFHELVDNGTDENPETGTEGIELIDTSIRHYSMRSRCPSGLIYCCNNYK